MKYDNIKRAKFISRPNRFIANIEIEGKNEICHVKNTGRCKELLIEGASIYVQEHDNSNRKTKYSLIGVWKDNMLVNMYSQVPNKVVFDGIKKGEIHELLKISHLKREVTFGKSRFDMYFEAGDEKGCIEVKGVTLEKNGLSMFPDAPTERGRKHVLEMIQAVNGGYRGIIFFLLQMKGPHLFKVNWKMDPKFSQAVKLASENGVEIMAYDSIVSTDGIKIGSQIEIDLSQ